MRSNNWSDEGPKQGFGWRVLISKKRIVWYDAVLRIEWQLTSLPLGFISIFEARANN